MEKISLQKAQIQSTEINRVVEVEKMSFDTTQESSLRPNVWEEYIGQEKIKKNLKIAIEASKKRGECLDHILFFWTSRTW